ncbi:MAG TPA: alpha/beta hydrolase [Burkholderiales bacterium]|nr:alpha/beta hydrolase [Burkholderiales bacterium]
MTQPSESPLRHAGRTILAAWAGLLLLPASIVGAQGTPSPLEVPARVLPVPTTVSPQMQKIIGTPINPNWRVIPQSPEEWKAQVEKTAAAAAKGLPAMRSALKVKIEAVTIDGVNAFMLTPEVVLPQNHNRLLIHVHGGCYVNGRGESGTGEATMMAGFGGFKVLSVDYRMPPDHPYPAALDDAMTVWKAAQKIAPAKNMGIIGSSAGGGLTLAMVLKAKMDKLPLPGAIAPGTPMSDLTGAGDSFQTNAMVDNVLIAYGASCDVRAGMYAKGRDLKDPLLSPVYGDMAGFPPTILNTGTRDLLLSNTVRVHRNLRRAGVIAELHVHEGQAHGGWYRDYTAPEAKETFEEIALFFDRYLGQ